MPQGGRFQILPSLILSLDFLPFIKPPILRADKYLKENRHLDMAVKKKPQQIDSNHKAYQKFDQLNGLHPWMSQVPKGFVPYKTRKLHKGKLAYFNFALAKEMGLLPKNHPNKMNSVLNKKILETFNIRIVNEYDLENKVNIKNQDLNSNDFMATRYLQLQHKNKQGKTSGDGRSIWNGFFEAKGKIWDVGSRGTGVTALAPGSVESDRPLQSGNTDFGYGCGLAEIDELYSAAIMAEVFHNKGIHTERVLAIIDSGNEVGIGVRAGLNLFRPAHLFVYLKQNDYESLKQATDFIIERQFVNGTWKFGPKSPKKYQYLLEEVCFAFAKFAAMLEREYIFTWLDWDGDNVLIDAGIIDYGSIRQFGLRHDEYRYDDVERFSTNLNEQKQKARLIIQTFAQLVDFLQNKTKKSLKDFSDHPTVKKFDSTFDYYLLDYFLYQVGLEKQHRDHLMVKHRKLVDSFYNEYLALEKLKTKGPQQKLSDGVNRPAILNMRKLLVELPNHIVNYSIDRQNISMREIYKTILAEEINRKDKKLMPQTENKLINVFEYYKKIAFLIGALQNPKQLNKIKQSASVRNPGTKLTGNALINIVSEILETKNKGLSQQEIQNIIDGFIEAQTSSKELTELTFEKAESNKGKALVRTMLTILDGHKEDI